MSERGRGGGLRILLLLGELHLRHGRDARDLRALPPLGCDLQHRGGELEVLFDQLEIVGGWTFIPSCLGKAETDSKFPIFLLLYFVPTF